MKRETRLGRTLGLWGAALIFVIIFIAYPTEFKWARWVYGLIWGGITTAVIFLFRPFFERLAKNEVKNRALLPKCSRR